MPELRRGCDPSVKRGTTEHPKFGALSMRLGLDQWETIGLLEALWMFTGRFAPRGDIGRWTDAQIAHGIGWKRTTAQELVTALTEETSRWLDALEGVRLYVHDWPQHCDDAIHMSLARAGMCFADGTIPKMHRLSEQERRECFKRFRAHGMRITGARRGVVLSSPVLSSPARPEKDSGGKPPSSPRGVLAEEFETKIRPVYPRRDGDQRWVQASSNYQVARQNGETFEGMFGGLERYVAWCVHKGIVGTSSVKQAASFFGREKCWRESWAIVAQPAKSANGGPRKLRLTDGRVITVPSGKKIQFTDNPDASPAYELPNGTLSVKSGASWVNA